MSSPAEKSPRLRILYVADVIGQPGFDLLKGLLPGLIRQRRLHLVVANGENAADGRGMTAELAAAYFECGIDVITSGNHIWDKHPIRRQFRDFPRLLRPLNYPPGAGGQGSVVVTARSGDPVAVINLQGRAFMLPIDCPFRTADCELKRLEGQTRIILVDMHAESTAEKQALAWYLDGRVSAVVGSHTHVQTADERILPKGTGYITDAGMTGPHDSIIGMHPKACINRFLYQTPHPFQVAGDNLRLNGVLLEINPAAGGCVAVQRLNLP